MNKFLISNNFNFVNEVVTTEIKELKLVDINYLKVSEKTDIAIVIEFLDSVPFCDTKKVLFLEVMHFSINELKEILKHLNDDVQVLAVSYLKNKLDKVDSKLSTLFKKNNFEILKNDKIDLKKIDTILKSKNLPISATTFINADNMDVVLSDISKIELLDEEHFGNVKNYISESFDSNVFELMDSILLCDATKVLTKLQHLKESHFALNRIILKQLDQIRIIKNYPNDIENALTIRGYSKIHPYRLQLMKQSAKKTNLNLDYAVMELMKNDINKSFNFETSLLKIISNRLI